MKAVTVLEMQELDRRAIEEIGIPSIVLMENAARGVSEVAIEELGEASGKKVAVICGIGNNGGDGLAASRYLLMRGAELDVFIVGDKSLIKNDPQINLNILEKMGLKIKEIAAPVKLDVDLIIDAIFGIGLKGEVKEPARSIIMDLNRQNVPVVSVDVPSGLDADTGEVLGTAVKAKKTATMHVPKRGFYINRGPELLGEIVVVDIGIPL